MENKTHGKKLKFNGLFTAVVAVCSLLILGSEVVAGEFKVVNTQMDISQNKYRLTAQLGYELSTEVNEALQNGIPITLRLDVEVLRKRKYLWAESVVRARQRVRLRYHALSEQYLVKNINTGEETFYKVLDDALYNMERIVNFPVMDVDVLRPGNIYIARVRTRVDLKELPSPLRFFAYFSSGWNLGSGWFKWSFPDPVNETKLKVNDQ